VRAALGRFDIRRATDRGGDCQRGASKMTKATVYLEGSSSHVRSRKPEAVASALTCLRLFGIDLPGTPDVGSRPSRNTRRSGRRLNGRPIERCSTCADDDRKCRQRGVYYRAFLSAEYFTDSLYCLHFAAGDPQPGAHVTGSGSAHPWHLGDHPLQVLSSSHRGHSFPARL